MGQPAVVGATLTRLEDARLFWRTPDGAEVSHSLEQILYLQITGWPEFNTAERHLRENHPQQALASYEKALADLTGAVPRPGRDAASPIDRGALLRCRMLRAAEADGRFELAVAIYVQLLESPGGLAMRVMQPRRTPDTGSPRFAAASKLLSAVIEKHGDDAVGRVLREWQSTWPAAKGAAGARTPAEPAVSTGAEWDRVEALNRAGRFDESLALLQERHQKTAGMERAETYYREGLTRLARAASGASQADADRRRAGIAFMRVVVHYPESPRAAEALVAAGQICREAGAIEQARAFWSEAIGRYPAGMAAVERARQELGRLAAVTQPSS